MIWARSRCHLLRLSAALGSCAVAILLAASVANAAFSDYGLENIAASESTTTAGAHPDISIGFNLKTDPTTPLDTNGYHESYGALKDLTVQLPPGLSGNPNNIPQCSAEQFATFALGGPGCPQDTQVGLSQLKLYNFFLPLTEPVFNMEPPTHGAVARLGFYAAKLPYFINISVRAGSDYGLVSKIENPPRSSLVGGTTVLWGVPADPSHDTKRLTPEEAFPGFRSESPPRASGLAPAPFMTNPTSCGGHPEMRVETDSYQTPGILSELRVPFPVTTGCDQLEFAPTFAAVPTSREAGGPTGLETSLDIPQNEAPYGRASSQLRGATVVLPEGMTISTGAAEGLEACSADQANYREEVLAECPPASKIGSAELDVPALARRMQGAVYQRTPEPGHLFRIWLVSDELGVHVKIPGEIHADPTTGQITSVFLDTPQVPVRQLKLRFKSGPHGVLVNPKRCGTYLTHFEFEPWAGNPAIVGETPMSIDERCAAKAFSPRLDGGTVSPSAGSFSPLMLDLSRETSEENLRSFETTMPPGLLAKVAGVPLCSSARAAAGACDAASRIGSIDVATGPGTSPLWIPQPGKEPAELYLAAPYQDAPYSIVAEVPAQAGPFNLGTVVTRAGLYIDPVTVQVTAKTDPLPQILEGVPIDYRSLHIELDRQNFALNPTSCAPVSLSARFLGAGGSAARDSVRFQAADCARLPFRPKLSLRLRGGTERGDYPGLTAMLRARRGNANIGRISVALPHSVFLAQEHIGTICTRVQFNANLCPKASVYGHAVAKTPLLDAPLRGPVYLRASSHVLPDLVVALSGEIEVHLAGKIDSVNGGIRTTFDQVPDAPVTRFKLKMNGGKRSLLVNSRDVCAGRQRAIVKVEGQNGKTADQRPVLKRHCS
jgi:hypothetical protein